MTHPDLAAALAADDSPLARSAEADLAEDRGEWELAAILRVASTIEASGFVHRIGPVSFIWSGARLSDLGELQVNGVDRIWHRWTAGMGWQAIVGGYARAGNDPVPCPPFIRPDVEAAVRQALAAQTGAPV